MNRELAKKVADAVLYEGYVLYPYRRSAIKNRQRWSFGILYPPDYREVSSGTERCVMHSECLLICEKEANLQIQLRFLHLLAGQVEQSAADGFDPVSSLLVDGHAVEGWDEGIARDVEFEVALDDGASQTFEFSFPGSYETELLRNDSGGIIGRISRTRQELKGSVSICAEKIRPDVLELSIEVSNKTQSLGNFGDRNSALLGSLLSAHTILNAGSGKFVSLLDPPDDLIEAVRVCKNLGNFPVLVGDADERDMLLCSPILLYDYPQIAPESAGDFYDATEMDEMLTLRVMTLSDQEKHEMRMANDQVRQILERTEQSAGEQLMKTHGTIRSLREVSDKQ
jgi:hypothetical protein